MRNCRNWDIFKAFFLTFIVPQVISSSRSLIKKKCIQFVCKFSWNHVFIFYLFRHRPVFFKINWIVGCVCLNGTNTPFSHIYTTVHINLNNIHIPQVTFVDPLSFRQTSFEHSNIIFLISFCLHLKDIGPWNGWSTRYVVLDFLL